MVDLVTAIVYHHHRIAGNYDPQRTLELPKQWQINGDNTGVYLCMKLPYKKEWSMV